jgi:hypothetical protein
MVREYIKNHCYVNSTLAMHVAGFNVVLVSDDESTWLPQPKKITVTSTSDVSPKAQLADANGSRKEPVKLTAGMRQSH